MTEFRHAVGWALLGMVMIASAGGAALGISESHDQATLKEAARNMQQVANYTEDVTQVTPQRTQIEHLVYDGPDRLGGYIQVGKQRQYVIVIGTTVYQTAVMATDRSTTHLTFYSQPAKSASSMDPVRSFIPVLLRATGVHHLQSVSSFTVSSAGQSVQVAIKVSGHYITDVSITSPRGHVDLTITAVGSSPTVGLPTGAKVVKLGGPSTTGG